jgi:hypothetical protein
MWTKRIKDIAAMLSIGDGALTLIGPRARPGVALRATGAARAHQLAGRSPQLDAPGGRSVDSPGCVAGLAAVPRVSSILGIGGGRPDGGTTGIER